MEEVQMRCFRRGLDAEVEKAAKVFFSSNIGKKIIDASYRGRPSFQVCIRDNYLNVYWHGCSVLKYEPIPEQFSIHHKYVDASQSQGENEHYVALDFSGNDLLFGDWSFFKKIIEPAYGGNIPCLEKYCASKGEKSKLSTYIDREKPLLMDLEIAFARQNNRSGKKRFFVADRVDMAELVIEGNSPMLRLVEVKLATDPRLRSESEPEIMTQMGYYREFLRSQKPNILNSYMTIAQNYKVLGITQLDGEMLKRFIERPEIHPEPHLLVLGKREELRGRKSCHWTTLLELFKKDGYPEPCLHDLAHQGWTPS